MDNINKENHVFEKWIEIAANTKLPIIKNPGTFKINEVFKEPGYTDISNETLDLSYYKELILESLLLFEEDHTGMIYNPISETWNWGF